MVMPMTRSPARFSIPATTELSTPPDIATAIVHSDISRRQLSQPRHDLHHGIDERVALLQSIRPPQRKTHAGPRLLAREPDRRQHVRRLGRAARARRSAGYGVTLQVQRNQQRLAIDAVETNIRSVAHAGRPRAVHM